MDAKDVWVVTKFIVSATGLKRRDARKLLDEIPGEHYSQLFLMARGWERDAASRASQKLEDLLGNQSLDTLKQATQLSKTPSGPGGEDAEPFSPIDDLDDLPPARKKKKPARRASR